MIVNRISVSLVLVDGEKVLMQFRDNKPGILCPGMWCIPGGRVEEKDVEAAVIREFKEETGYNVEKPKFYWIEYYKTPDGKIIKNFRFLAVYDRKQKIKCLEGQKMEFLTVEELEKLQVVSGQIKAITKAIEIVRNGGVVSEVFEINI